MRLYVAGSPSDPRIFSGAVFRLLAAAGHQVVSHWHLPGAWSAEERRSSLPARASIARANYRDLDASDAVYALPYKSEHRRGLHAEVGYALGRGKPVIVEGDEYTVNTMLNVEGVFFARTPAEILITLRKVQAMVRAPGGG